MTIRRWSRTLRIATVALLAATLAAPVAHVSPTFAEPLPEARGVDLGAGVELRSFADGPVAGGDDLTLVVERIAIAPGASIAPATGAQIVEVETGFVAFEDDLGLEAELAPGGAQFFSAAEAPVLTNVGDTPATVIRSTLRGAGAGSEATNDADAEETGDAEDTGDGANPDDEVGERPSGSRPGAGATALASRQTGDPAILTILEDACDPAELTVVRGGSVIVENASGEERAFTVDRLDLVVELADGDIEEITLDGPPGVYTFGCSVLDEATDSLSGELTIVAADATTPEADETPAAAETPSATVDIPAGEPGVLLEEPIDGDLPADARYLAARLIIGPGGVVDLDGSAGPFAVVVEGGPVIIQRPDRVPGRLRDGRGVVIPAGQAAAIVNQGDEPVVLLLSGIALPDTAVGDGGDTGDSGDDADQGGNDAGDTGDGGDALDGATLLPDDSALEELGLETAGRPQQSDDPTDAGFYFDDEATAEELLPGYGWLSVTQQEVGAIGDDTDYGLLESAIIAIDVFEDAQGASDYMTYIEETWYMSGGRTSRIVGDLEGVDGHFYLAVYLEDEEMDIGVMTIQRGEAVITILVAGPDLDCKALMEDLAIAIFSPRG